MDEFVFDDFCGLLVDDEGLVDGEGGLGGDDEGVRGGVQIPNG
eukprot:CAMPEP_0170563434 /NCGR_PEP_ID=MMETSP0211-20121228/66558_1 /TAXON_ID=311385 /ORGANISM="Pseudokeronopsis sp., Strain OXSARD2" /LENGTH=42 /DNA_ID= /DNA_START= /DNA_END= /DNA_ORIENTATION=